jgi:ADP-ribosyl-[dinitrogen reductase] hydrolase
MENSKIAGSILGTAIGDAIGLPYEGLSRRRGVKILGIPDRHRLLFGWGMVSDDTEHTCMVAQSLIAAGDNLPKFQHQLAGRFRLWLLLLPAGVGFATLRAIGRLWMGFNPERVSAPPRRSEWRFLSGKWSSNAIGNFGSSDRRSGQTSRICKS